MWPSATTSRPTSASTSSAASTARARASSHEGDRALRAGNYREAARAYRDAAGLVPSERMLLWKARVLRPAPRLVGPLVRARQLRIERALGMTEEHVR